MFYNHKIFVQYITKVLTIEKEKQTEKKNTDWKPVKQSIIFNIGYNTDYDNYKHVQQKDYTYYFWLLIS